ncbi:hypothetical protein PF003_g21982 [Phytophthora fragariae]|nr:hypothetical protein PF003_g21982 [Phytophthora fragariae]
MRKSPPRSKQPNPTKRPLDCHVSSLPRAPKRKRVATMERELVGPDVWYSIKDNLAA